MAYQFSTIAPDESDSSVQVLGETGGTIVHIFPNGRAHVKKGKKKNLRHQPIQKQGRTTKVSKSTSSKFNSNTSNPNPLNSNSKRGIQPPPPPPLRPGCLGFGAQSLSEVDGVSVAAVTPKSQKDLGQYLVQQKLLTSVQLEVAEYDVSTSDMSLEDILIARAWITPDVIEQFENASPRSPE